MTPTNNARTAALEALIDSHAVELKLPTLRRQFRSVAEQAIREQQTPVEYLAALLEAETAERAERRERRRLLDARFPALKRLEDFRFDDNPRIPRATIAALAEGSWIDGNESVIFVGDSGTGKTMLATALGVCACQQGRRVKFITLAALANELQEALSRDELSRVVARYARIDVLLVCNEREGQPRGQVAKDPLSATVIDAALTVAAAFATASAAAGSDDETSGAQGLNSRVGGRLLNDACGDQRSDGASSSSTDRFRGCTPRLLRSLPPWP